MEKTLNFEFYRESKRAAWFKEVVPEKGKLSVRTLCVRKTLFEGIKPTELQLTVSFTTKAQSPVPPQ